MSVLVTGVSYDNRGAELLMQAAADRITSWGPAARPVVSYRCGTPAQRRRTGVGTHVSVLQAGRLHHGGLGFLPAAARRLLNVSTDDDLVAVLDASGFVLSDQWGEVPARRLLRRVRVWTSRGLPVVLLPQAFGPFEHPGVAAATRDILGACRLAYARDTESLQHLRGLGLTDDVAARLRSAPDITIGLDAGVEAVDAGDTPIVPNGNIARRAPTPGHRAAYLDALVEAVRAVREVGGTPFGLCHAGADDLALLSELSAAAGGLPVVAGRSGPECKAIIAGSRGVVSGRFHACVSALSCGVPVVLHGWSHKYRELAADFDRLDAVADPYDPAETGRAVRRVVGGGTLGGGAATARHTVSVAAMWDEVATVVPVDA